MDVQTLFAEAPIERFNRRVVGRLAPATEVENNAVRVRPEIHGRADELATVVAVDALRQAPFKAQALEGRDDIPSTEPLADIDRQALAGEEVDHRQCAEAPTIRELVGHEVHTPDLIARHCRPTSLSMDRARMPP